MRVFVRFQVPVLVEVDLDSGAVVSVVVDDERAVSADEVFSLDGDVTDTERGRATDIAENAGWPAWRLGE